MALAGRLTSHQGLFLQGVNHIHEILGLLLKKISLNFTLTHVFSLPLEIFSDFLDKSFELSSSIVSTVTGSQVWKSLYLSKVCTILVKHHPIKSRQSWGGFTLEKHFVEVFKTFFLHNQTEVWFRDFNNSVLTSSFDVNLFMWEPLANSNGFHKQPLRCHTFTLCHSSGVFQSITNKSSSFFVQLVN